MAVGDFNGDGRPDLVLTNYVSGVVEVLLNTTPTGSTAPSFNSARTFAVGANPFSVAVGDFNGDGRPDLAVANNSSDTVSVLLNTTAAGAAVPSFSGQQTFATSSSPISVAVADLNGDGRPDLAVADYTNHTLTLLVNQTAANAGSVSFPTKKTILPVASPDFVTAADFNGDGRPDLVLANGNGTASVLLNKTGTGDPTPEFPALYTFAVASSRSLAAGDFDGDGRPDLAAAGGAGKMSVLINTTAAGAVTPSFAAQQTFAIGNNAFSVAAADLNGDGRPDLVTANANSSGNVSVLLDTTTSFSSAPPVVVGQFGSSGVWEYNRSTGGWAQLTTSNASLLAADAKGDVVGEFPGGGVWLYRPATWWKQINGVDASALAMDANGDIVAQFPGYGVGEYLPSTGWRSLTGANASLLAMDALGDVVGEFPGYGVWEFHPASGWKLLNGVDASALAMDAVGDVAVNFPGYGVAEYRPASGWALLNGTQAQSVAVDAAGDVTAEFHGYGVGEYLPAGGWRTLTASEADGVAMGGNGDAFGNFGSGGVWEYEPFRGWVQITASDASFFAVA
jgi:hypothetical protein